MSAWQWCRAILGGGGGTTILGPTPAEEESLRECGGGGGAISTCVLAVCSYFVPAVSEDPPATFGGVGA